MKGESEAWGSLRTQERRQCPGKARQARDPRAQVGGGQCWLKMRLWCPQLYEETWPQCLVEGRECGVGVDILLGTRPPFSGSRGLAEGIRFRLREGQLERPSILLPATQSGSGNSASV